MLLKLPKFIILLFIVLILNNSAYSQDFYKDYRSFLRSNINSVKPNHLAAFRRIDTLIKRLHLATDRFDKQKGHSFFNSDTIYLVNFQGVETGITSAMIWNRSSSCYYEYSFILEHWKKTSENLEIKTDASEILKSFNKDFRHSIETGDTTAYHKYADKNKVFDGESVSPVMAVKKRGKWYFLPFPGNGWAIKY